MNKISNQKLGKVEVIRIQENYSDQARAADAQLEEKKRPTSAAEQVEINEALDDINARYLHNERPEKKPAAKEKVAEDTQSKVNAALDRVNSKFIRNEG